MMASLIFQCNIRNGQGFVLTLPVSFFFFTTIPLISEAHRVSSRVVSDFLLPLKLKVSKPLL
jgi:hypothetical protein